MPAKQPQDHQPADKRFTFRGRDGKTYRLPDPDVDQMDGGELMDAIEGGDLGMVRYSLRMLDKSGVDPEAMKALRGLKGTSVVQVLDAWTRHGGDGTSLGE